MDMQTFNIISPIDGSVLAERNYHDFLAVDRILNTSVKAQKEWRNVSLKERKKNILKFIDAFVGEKKAISEELTRQMGRPIRYSPGEVTGTGERALGMTDLSDSALQDILLPGKKGFHRFIRREPLGVVFVIPAWNYPYLIAVNSVIPALLAGNAVVLKPSSQTPLCGERFSAAFEKAGLPKGLYQILHLTHHDTAKVIQDNRVNFVAFTGSVGGGHAVQKAATGRFINIGLELGGKDPAYVRRDANLKFAAENLVEGAFFNSGQSCCGIERIYVDVSLFDDFVEQFVNITYQNKLGNPLDQETTLGPMAKENGADQVRTHIEEALSKDALALIDTTRFPETKLGKNYLAPQVLVNVDHSMAVMKEETFGPVVGIMKVKNDEEALRLMNDSPYGLTASVWTDNEEEALRLAEQVETGTCFMNRCDYLDPGLAWVGVKNTGKGCTLSKVGYEQLTRPKSFHFKKRI